MSSSNIENFLSSLESGDEEKILTTLKEVRKIKGKQTAAQIIQYIKSNDSESLNALLTSLLLIKGKLSHETFYDLLPEDKWSTLDIIASEIADINNPKIYAFFRHGIKHPDWKIRQALVYLLGDYVHNLSYEFLMECRYDESSAVQKTAKQSLEKMNATLGYVDNNEVYTQFVKPLEHELFNDKSTILLRMNAFEYLKMIPQKYHEATYVEKASEIIEVALLDKDDMLKAYSQEYLDLPDIYQKPWCTDIAKQNLASRVDA